MQNLPTAPCGTLPALSSKPEVPEMSVLFEGDVGGAPLPASFEGAARLCAVLLDPDTASDAGMRSALAQLTEDNQALTAPDTDSNTILHSLASQLRILEAIFQRFTLEASRQQPADRSAALAKVALNAQAAYLRTAALIVTARTAP